MEGLLFCVVGHVHPPDRYLAYLKYAPAESGKWRRGAVAYRRQLPYYHVRHALGTVAWLERHHPGYVWDDPTTGLRFSFVPREAVARYYRPEARLAEILAGPRDPLEAEVAALVGHLTRETGLPSAAFGITGSILLGLHDPAFSDVDLLVYGAANARAVRAAVGALTGSVLASLPEARRARWRAETASRFGLREAEVAHLERRRWNYVLFGGRYVSIHPTRRDDEIDEAYGARRFRRLGPATVVATVRDAGAAMFLPAVYAVEAAVDAEGRPCRLEEVVSFEGLFGGCAEPGERVVAAGQLEEDQAGRRRLVVGAAGPEGGGFIRPARAGEG